MELGLIQTELYQIEKETIENILYLKGAGHASTSALSILWHFLLFFKKVSYWREPQITREIALTAIYM